MNKALVLGLGILLIATAFLVASRTSTQDAAPEQARVFATTLHTTPTPTFIPTSTPSDTPLPTPLPTITPLAGWTRFRGSGAELWLPSSYEGQMVDVPPDVQHDENSSLLAENIVVYGTHSELTPDLAARTVPSHSVRIARLQVSADPELFPYTIVGLGFYDFRLGRSRRVYMGRYGGAYSTIATGPATDGTVLTKLLYWFEQGNQYWLVIYSTPAAELQEHLAVFEQSIRTFTILP